MLLTWPAVITIVIVFASVVVARRRALRPAQRRELRAVEDRQLVIVHHAVKARREAGAAKAEADGLRERVAELERRAA